MKRNIRIIAMVIIITVIFTNISMAADLSSKAGKVVTESTSLNIRSGTGTNFGIVGKLDKGSYITLLSEINGWWRVEYGDGKIGYVSANYISEVKESNAYYVNTESTRLNVRTGPGTNYIIISKLDKDKDIVVLSITNCWAKIIYEGVKIGYVSSSFLANHQQAYKYPSVSLAVNRYAQADMRWANTKIGILNTIGEIGCLTTAIAMTESYRTNSVITPDVMAKNLMYTASGAMYWPIDYLNDYTYDYLTETYNLLQEGKPVLIGGKTASGGQHWVVVTGYTGGDTLTPSNFTIADPGKANRTNLAQFMLEYPIHYKIAYYI